ncbi:MAG: type II toxin-antitoxin system HicA family toxin [Actinomycetota bacterium]|nr:type II toxin-antitoxin system HicA family toxin [Actinomycetota bacterium]
MGRRRKLLERILIGRSDANIPFEQTRTLLKALGFSESIRGSHHKFIREGVEELINLQEVEGKCKPYQVRQMREVILKYNLGQEL